VWIGRLGRLGRVRSEQLGQCGETQLALGFHGLEMIEQCPLVRSAARSTQGHRQAFPALGRSPLRAHPHGLRAPRDPQAPCDGPDCRLPTAGGRLGAQMFALGRMSATVELKHISGP
jgi:hypothetical protein